MRRMSDDMLHELLGEYLHEGRERLESIEQALLGLMTLSGEERKGTLRRVKRDLHTLKGNSGMMGFEDLQTLAHQLEDRVEGLGERATDVAAFLEEVDRFRAGLEGLAPAPDAATRGGADEDANGDADSAAAEEELLAAILPQQQEVQDKASVRVRLDHLDRMVSRVTELITLRSRVAEALARGLSLDPEEEGYDEASQAALALVGEAFHSLESGLKLLQTDVLGLRTVSLRPVFRQLLRVVHDVSFRSEKTVRLVTRGEDTPLDRALSEMATESLGHMVRNAIAHGIESPAERQRAGKPEEGVVLVEASVAGGAVNIDVLDDGAGIDKEALAAAARDAGLDITDQEDLQSLLFLPGLSTRDGADMSAGRGIGMTAVHDAVREVGGTIQVTSEGGLGTRFLLRLPLRVSVVDALPVRVDGTRYALPVATVLEATPLSAVAKAGEVAEGLGVWRDRSIQLIDLGLFFRTSPVSRPRRFVVVVEAETALLGLMVDDSEQPRELVVKGLDEVVGQPAGIAGSAILGDGKVVLILDPPSLVTRRGRRAEAV